MHSVSGNQPVSAFREPFASHHRVVAGYAPFRKRVLAPGDVGERVERPGSCGSPVDGVLGGFLVGVAVGIQLVDVGERTVARLGRERQVRAV